MCIWVCVPVGAVWCVGLRHGAVWCVRCVCRVCNVTLNVRRRRRYPLTLCWRCCVLCFHARLYAAQCVVLAWCMFHVTVLRSLFAVAVFLCRALACTCFVSLSSRRHLRGRCRVAVLSMSMAALGVCVLSGCVLSESLAHGAVLRFLCRRWWRRCVAVVALSPARPSLCRCPLLVG